MNASKKPSHISLIALVLTVAALATAGCATKEAKDSDGAMKDMKDPGSAMKDMKDPGSAMTDMKEPAGAMMGAAASLSGEHEVPPVTTGATGKSTIKVGADKKVTGTVTTEGIVATAAHIHMGAAGANGPVVVPLTKTSDTLFSAPDNTVLTDAQYASYQAGELYVNVHSAAHAGGEIRVQLSAK